MRKLWFGLVGSSVLGVSALSGGLAWAQQDPLPEGPGKADILSGCVSCHGAEVITAQKRTQAEWGDIMTRMLGYGAQSDAQQQKAISDYLSKNFSATPEAKS